MTGVSGGRVAGVLLAATAVLAGCGNASEPLEGNVPRSISAAAPGAPVGLSVEHAGDALIARWTASPIDGDAPLSGFRVFPGTREPVLLPADRTEYVMANLSRSDLLVIQVAAVSEAGQGEAAAAWTDLPPRQARTSVRLSKPVSTTVSSPEPSAPRQAPPTATSSARVSTSEPPAPRASPTPTPTPTAAAVKDIWPDVFAGASPSVLQVLTTTCRGVGSVGTAFFVGPNLLATAAHNVDGAQVVQVLTEGPDSDGIPAAIIGFDRLADVALLRLERSTTGRALVMADTPPAVGSPIGVIGFAESLGKSLQVGHVSAHDVRFYEPGVGLRTRLLQSDVQTNHGASGGPLVDRAGRVVGLVSLAVGNPQNVNLAASVTTMRPLIDAWTATPGAKTFC